MSTRQRKFMLLVIVLILATLTAYMLWPVRSIDTPTSNVAENSNFDPTDSITATPPTSNSSQSSQPAKVPAANDPETDGLLMPVDGRAQLVAELLDKDLPIVPNFRQSVKQRLQDKTIQQMVEEIGDTWAATGISGGIAWDAEDTAWLLWSFKQNLRVKRLIEMGRKEPELVGALVSKDLMLRTNQWYDTVQAYNKATANNTTAGFATSNDGETIGSNAFQKYLEDQYAVVAEMFVIMNIGYTKGLGTLAKFTRWQRNPYQELIMTRNGPVMGFVVGRERTTPKERFNSDILFFAAATLLQNSTDKKHDKARTALQKILKGKPVCRQVTTDAPDALWADTDPVLAMTGVDAASEPKMTLLLPNPDIVGPIDRWPFDRSRVLSRLVDAYRNSEN